MCQTLMEGIPYSPAQDVSSSRDDLILYYSLAGFTTSTIQRFLCDVNGIDISKRHIRRIRRRLGVSSSTAETPMSVVCSTIRVCRLSYAIHVPRVKLVCVCVYMCRRKNYKVQVLCLVTVACGID